MLVIISMLAVVATTVMYRMRAEVYAAGATSGAVQARLAAISGIEQAMAVLCRNSDNQTAWWDNPTLFRDQVVADEGSVRWCFTVYATSRQNGQTVVRYGVIDEGAKININSASVEALAHLPGMTEQLAEAVVDYRDRDNKPLPQGAEQEFYDRLPNPYTIRNGPLESLDELLLVRGFTAGLIYGSDPNNYARRDGGLAAVATAATYTSDPYANDPNQKKFNLNGNLRGLRNVQVSQATRDYIRIYRQEGNVFGNPLDLLDANYAVQVDHPPIVAGQEIGSGVEADSFADIEKLLVAGAVDNDIVVDPNVAVDPNFGGRSIKIEGLGDEAESAEESQAPVSAGRININTAPVEVLALLPGVDNTLAERIVQARTRTDPNQLILPTWLYTQKLVDVQEFRKLAPMINTTSKQFRVQVVGYGLPKDGGRAAGFCVLEAIIDLSSSSPRISYVRDLTRLGLPLPVGQSQSF